MKRFWIWSALALIAIIALGLILTEVSEINECKKFLINIGDSYKIYVDGIAEYNSFEDKTSERAIQIKEHAFFNGDAFIFYLQRLPDKYDEETISIATRKLSLSEMENLHGAITFYEENIAVIEAEHDD